MQVFESTLNYKPDSIRYDGYEIMFTPLEETRYMMVTHAGNEIFDLTGFRIDFGEARNTWLMNVYLPTGLLTFVSFIGFFIPVEIVPGRMALLVTIFLMLVNIRSVQYQRAPLVNERNWIKCIMLTYFVKQRPLL